jgi:hypothetical protein
MFGMLDYRAHKLFWLFSLPIRLVGWLLFFVTLGIGIAVAQWVEYPTIIRIVIGYVTFEAVGLIMAVIYQLLMWIVRAVFFWIIDVVPSKGADEEEAREVVVNGPATWLVKKLSTDIEKWTTADTRALASTMNWRARLLFNARERLETRVERFQQYYYDTGRQPGVLTKDEVDKLVGDLKEGWFQIAIVNPYFFRSIVGAFIIAFAVLLYLRTPP